MGARRTSRKARRRERRAAARLGLTVDQYRVLSGYDRDGSDPDDLVEQWAGWRLDAIEGASRG